jgi:hypothetical protein
MRAVHSATPIREQEHWRRNAVSSAIGLGIPPSPT